MIGKIWKDLKGWPVKCPNCDSWNFNYISDRGGNHRLYRCKKCLKKFIARWKGEKIRSCLSEPKNTKMQNWDWIEVLGRLEESVIDVEYEIVTDEFRDGTEAMCLEVGQVEQ